MGGKVNFKDLAFKDEQQGAKYFQQESKSKDGCNISVINSSSGTAASNRQDIVLLQLAPLTYSFQIVKLNLDIYVTQAAGINVRLWDQAYFSFYNSALAFNFNQIPSFPSFNNAALVTGTFDKPMTFDFSDNEVFAYNGTNLTFVCVIFSVAAFLGTETINWNLRIKWRPL